MGPLNAFWQVPFTGTARARPVGAGGIITYVVIISVCSAPLYERDLVAEKFVELRQQKNLWMKHE